MISRLVTVDLILMMSQRLHQFPGIQGTDPLVLYDICRSVLNEWARRIESDGLSVSLNAIAENALFLFSLPNNQRGLIDLGNDLINRARDIEEHLGLKRYLSLGQPPLLAKLEKAARTSGTLKWFDAAKRVMDLKNSTDASEQLRSLLEWLPRYVDPDGSSFDEFSAFGQILASSKSDKQPDLPEQLVSELALLVPVFRTLKRAYNQ
jgi:hypothetical protein